jgi:hypothetical protein
MWEVHSVALKLRSSFLCILNDWDYRLELPHWVLHSFLLQNLLVWWLISI